MKIIDLEQGTPEWLEFRRSHLGASDCATIMGEDPYRTPYQLWKQKVLDETVIVTPAMKRGSVLEPEARKKIEQQDEVEYPPVCVVSEDFPWMMASLDGLSKDGVILEIKCPTETTFNSILNDDALIIPIHWQWQVQHQLCVTGLKEAILFIFSERGAVKISITRDELMIASLIEKERDFWNKHVLAYCAPALSDEDFEERNDLVWEELAIRWRDANRARLEAEKEEDAVRKLLIEAAGDKSCRGGGIKVTRFSKAGNIDYKSIPNLKDIDLEKYRKPDTVQWRIS